MDRNFARAIGYGTVCHKHSDAGVDFRALGLFVREVVCFERCKCIAYAKSVHVNFAKATAVGVAIDVAIQLIASGEVDPKSLAINAGGIFLGMTVGQATHEDDLEAD